MSLYNHSPVTMTVSNHHNVVLVIFRGWGFSVYINGVGRDTTQLITRVSPGLSPLQTPATPVSSLSSKHYLGVAAVKFTGRGMLDSSVKSSKRKIFQAFLIPYRHELTGYSHEHPGGSLHAQLTSLFPTCHGRGRALWLEGPET